MSFIAVSTDYFTAPFAQIVLNPEGVIYQFAIYFTPSGLNVIVGLFYNHAIPC